MVEPIKYVCVKACFYRDRLWAPGEILEPVDGETVNKHFKPISAIEPEKPEEVVTEVSTLAQIQQEEDRKIEEQHKIYEQRAKNRGGRRKGVK